LARGLAGLWLFNENGGDTAKNLIAPAGDGALTATAWDTGNPGKPGPALLFNGTSSFVDIPAHAQINTLGAMSVVLWLFITSETPGHVLLSKTDSGLTKGWRVAITGSGGFRIQFRRWFTSGNKQRRPIGVVENRWQQIVLTDTGSITGSDIKGYYDGREATYATTLNATSGTPADDSTENLWIGQGVSGDPFLGGRVDHVRIYNRVLSPSEVQQLYVNPFADFVQPVSIAFRAFDDAGAPPPPPVDIGYMVSEVIPHKRRKRQQPSIQVGMVPPAVRVSSGSTAIIDLVSSELR
jgi:hypothetical protein